MTDKLKPCPWCGNDARLVKEEIHFPNSQNNLWAVTCDTENCPAGNIVQDGEMGGFIYSWPKDEAIEIWNRRSAS